MKIIFESIKPIYQQIADGIEDDIIEGKLNEGEQSYSQLIISREFNVNPATAAKGINVLVQKGILEKQRGLSMIVATGARERLLSEKKDNYIFALASELVAEAKKIGMPEQDVSNLICDIFKRGMD